MEVSSGSRGHEGLIRGALHDRRYEQRRLIRRGHMQQRAALFNLRQTGGVMKQCRRVRDASNRSPAHAHMFASIEHRRIVTTSVPSRRCQHQDKGESKLGNFVQNLLDMLLLRNNN